MAPPILLRGGEVQRSGMIPRWLLAEPDKVEEKDEQTLPKGPFVRPPKVQCAGTDPEAVELLQQSPVCLEIFHMVKRTPVGNMLEDVRNLIAEGKQVGGTDTYGRNALHYLAKKEGVVDVAWLILEKFVELKKNIAMSDQDGQTPFDLAVANKNIHMTVLLAKYSKMSDLQATLAKMQVDVNEANLALNHIVGKPGYEEVAYALLQSGTAQLPTALIKTDANQKTPLELAIDKGLDKMTALLMNFLKAEKIREIFSSGHKFYSLIETFHKDDLDTGPWRVHKKKTKQAVMTVLDACCEQPETEAGLEMAHFGPLNTKGENGETAYALLARLGIADYLNHKVVKRLSKYKWKSVRWLYWTISVFNFIMIGVLTAAAVLAFLSTNPTLYHNTPADKARGFCEGIVGLWILLMAIGEITQFCLYKKNYFHDGWNCIEIIIILLAFILVFLRSFESEAQWPFYSFFYLISVFRFVKLFAVYAYLHTYAISIMKMWKEFMAFILLFIIALVACVGAFFIGDRVHFKLPEVNKTAPGNIDRNGTRVGQIVAVFGSSARILVDAGVRDAISDAYQSVKEGWFYPMVMLWALVFISTIILVNVLIAQLSHKYRVAEIQGKRASWSKVAWTISIYEGILSKVCRRAADPPSCKKISKKIKAEEKFSEFEPLNNRIDELQDTLSRMKDAERNRTNATKEAGDRLDKAISDLETKTQNMQTEWRDAERNRTNATKEAGDRLDKAIGDFEAKSQNMQTEWSKQLLSFQTEQNAVLKQQLGAMADGLKTCFDDFRVKLEETAKAVEEAKLSPPTETL